MEFKYTILYVENVEKTVEFYVKAFGFEVKFISPEKDYAELITSGVTLSFASKDLGKSNFKDNVNFSDLSKIPFGFELAFTTKKIEEDFKKAIDNGAIEFQSLQKKEWGQIVGYVKDLNGFLIEICTPIK